MASPTTQFGMPPSTPKPSATSPIYALCGTYCSLRQSYWFIFLFIAYLLNLVCRFQENLTISFSCIFLIPGHKRQHLILGILIMPPVLQDFISMISDQTHAPCSFVLFLFLFTRLVESDSLRHHGLQHTRLPCLSLSPRVCSNACSLNQ